MIFCLFQICRLFRNSTDDDDEEENDDEYTVDKWKRLNLMWQITPGPLSLAALLKYVIP